MKRFHVHVSVEDLAASVRSADAALIEEAQTTCCYSRADKYWVTDPTGIAWESYHTHGDAPMYGQERKTAKESCCGPGSAKPSIPVEQPKPKTAAKCCG